MKEWNVLAVDDDPEKLDELERVLTRGIDGDTFQLTKETSFDAAMHRAKNERYDFVFLDVHEEAGDPDPNRMPDREDQKGEDVLREIQKTLFMPVIFYTGWPAKVEHLRSPLVQVVGKGADVQEIREAVRLVLQTKLPQLAKHIEEQSRSYMWGALSSILSEDWDKLNPRDLSLLLARNLAKNLSQRVVKEILEIHDGDIEPLEMYLFPPDNRFCHPADIFKHRKTGGLWMVLTPACDFEQDKAEKILMAKVTPITDIPEYNDWVAEADKFKSLPVVEQIKANKKSLNMAKDWIRQLVKGKAGERYRFLPGTFFIPDCVVDFQDLTHFVNCGDEEFSPICSLDNPYREEMLTAFSRYYGRIGTPDYDLETVWQRIDDSFNEKMAG